MLNGWREMSLSLADPYILPPNPLQPYMSILLLEDRKEKNLIYGFGFDKKTKKIFIAPDNRELEIFVDQVKINQ